MAMGVSRRRGGAIAEINVTPMADVMIVLLIIFMVATPLIGQPPVRLPRAEHTAERRGERLEILLRRDGSVLVAGTPLPVEALSEWMAGRASAARTTVLVQADREAPYDAVARVLAACRAAGVAEVGLAAQRRVGP
ncbi:MAG: ExbD/TolR family protein [Betaproteobacteria bacterium]|jgi:biopolymer transport protein ExbD